MSGRRYYAEREDGTRCEVKIHSCRGRQIFLQVPPDFDNRAVRGVKNLVPVLMAPDWDRKIPEVFYLYEPNPAQRLT